ncbi:MAG: hypothetical protein CVU18_19830 [Betaproteobacteria bacterium HGW-Betaproteobacteria-12]|nr:MAG: hypothetical protein CVU18_19830 [Betaproteobacteria bacterium HGW-Betaproteobacteria-12]
MNKTANLLVAATLGISLVGNAQARDDRRHGHDHRPPHFQKFKHHHHHAPRVIRHRDHDWIGPAALIALTGVAIGAAVHYQTPPSPAYSAPPPSGNWYYCGSSGQYYPYTNACPEGWQAVPPR